MNIMYIAPRYHTNQIPIMKGWLEKGDNVIFISQYAGKTEDYTYLKPTILGYSSVFHAINWVYTNLINRKIRESANIFSFQMKYGFPPMRKLSKIIKEFKPDVVILRERSVYNIFAYSLCKHKCSKVILYNQSPLWSEAAVKTDLPHRLVRKLMPPTRITPVMGMKTEKSQKEDNSYFIPFVVEPKIAPEQKLHFQNNRINIICIAKYETRKNILMLLKIVKELSQEYPLYVTIVGEVSTIHHETHYDEVLKYIENIKLQEQVALRKNITMVEVYEEYKQADLFVLPSTKEFASISQLEAMACSLPIICSDTNGAACYIEDEKNGYLFIDNSPQSLSEKLKKILQSKEQLIKMGEYSYQLAMRKYSFPNYKQKVQELM